MAIDKHSKLEQELRISFREYLLGKDIKGKQKAIFVPRFSIPRSEQVDLVLAPKEGTTLFLTQRADFLSVYRHTVGQLVGVLVHLHKMTDRQVREALRVCKEHPDLLELKQGQLDTLTTSKRLISDKKAGKLTIALVTDVPEVVEQARELAENFLGIANLLNVWMTTAVKRKKLCQSVDFYALKSGPQGQPPLIQPLKAALMEMIKD